MIRRATDERMRGAIRHKGLFNPYWGLFLAGERSGE